MARPDRRHGSAERDRGREGGPHDGELSNPPVNDKVTGVVKVGRTPATGGKLSYDPSNAINGGVPERAAAIGRDGTYTVETLAGVDKISVEVPNIHDDSTEFEVKPRDNVFDIDVKQ